MSDLSERLLAVHRALGAQRIPHAFGGAIALAYWTLEPRGTRDIDVNIFLPAAESARALRALPDGVVQPEGTEELVARDGQIRLWWEGTPVDLFFDYDPLHAAAARNRRVVEFAGSRIPVLGPVELAVFKAMLDRSRDWADIESMIEARTLDTDAVEKELKRLIGPHDERFAHLKRAEQRAEPPGPG